MLRVSYSDTAGRQCWSLYGRLAGPWVDEFRSCWREARQRAPLARAVVDLKEVIFIDEAGERLLAEMKIAGAELIASGVENKHLIASLRNGQPRISEQTGPLRTLGSRRDAHARGEMENEKTSRNSRHHRGSAADRGSPGSG